MFFHSFELSLLGEAYLAAGRLEEATQFAERAFHLACERDERGHQAWALRLIGEIATRHTPAEVTAAGDAYQQALTLARQLGMRPLEARCHLGLGTLYQQTGHSQANDSLASRAHLETAAALFRKMDMQRWLQRAGATPG